MHRKRAYSIFHPARSLIILPRLLLPQAQLSVTKGKQASHPSGRRSKLSTRPCLPRAVQFFSLPILIPAYLKLFWRSLMTTMSRLVQHGACSEFSWYHFAHSVNKSKLHVNEKRTSCLAGLIGSNMSKEYAGKLLINIGKFRTIWN